MATLAERLKSGLRSAFPALNRKKQLQGLEERQTRPTKAEKVVVRPRKKVKKRKPLKTD